MTMIRWTLTFSGVLDDTDVDYATDSTSIHDAGQTCRTSLVTDLGAMGAGNKFEASLFNRIAVDQTQDDLS